MATSAPPIWEQAQALVASYGPWAVTELHMIASALLPIYAGAHASLSRPLSAARPVKKKGRKARRKDESEAKKMEGLSPMDAIIYPILAGSMLTGLYYLIKWLQDPAIINKIINGYLSIFGVFAISQFLTDATTTAVSFVFPLRYFHNGTIWKARMEKEQFAARSQRGNRRVTELRSSPLPGVLSRLPLSKLLSRLAWKARLFLLKPLYILELYIKGGVEASLAVGPLRELNNAIATGIVLYYNFVDKPWWMTNLYGFSMAYGSLQLMSPSTFATGNLVLMALFFYDIYFVFYTPMMITVATQIEAPVKLLIPRPAAENDDPTKQALSMLGLGDIVIPGMMIGQALRFDLYMHYLKKQRRNDAQPPPKSSNGTATKPKSRNTIHSTDVVLTYDEHGVGRAPYQRATGNWGERFWLGSAATERSEGGVFAKPYFTASITGYVLGMLATLAVLYIYQHGQPALLYLVPGVLGSQWLTALARGEIGHMWAYSELEEEKTRGGAGTGTKKSTVGPPSEGTDHHPADASGEEDNHIAREDEEAPSSSLSGSGSDSEPEPATLASYESLPITRPEHAYFTLSFRSVPTAQPLDERTPTAKPSTGRRGARRAPSKDAEEAALAEPVMASPARNTRAQSLRKRRT